MVVHLGFHPCAEFLLSSFPFLHDPGSYSPPCPSLLYFGDTITSALPHGLLCLASLLLDELANSYTRKHPAENQWLHLPLITKLKKDCGEIFPVAEYAYTTIPTYPSGQIGFMVCCKDPNRNVREPLRSWTREEELKLCKYYNSEIHKASFILPTFAQQALDEKKAE